MGVGLGTPEVKWSEVVVLLQHGAAIMVAKQRLTWSGPAHVRAAGCAVRDYAGSRPASGDTRS